MSKEEKNFKKVVSFDNLPTHPAKVIYLAAIAWLYIDRYQAPGWLIGVIGTIMALILLASIIAFIKQTPSEVVFTSDMIGADEEWPYKKMWNRGKLQ